MAEAKWTIRLAFSGDSEAVSAVLTRAAVAAWGDFLGSERIERANRDRRHPADLVAVDEQGIFAFVAWDAATGEITRLYTDPRGWGRGAGSALLDLALGALEEAGCRRAWLNTEERNERALRFYRARGWREQGEPRVRDWHGARLREPRLVHELSPDREADSV